MPWWGLRYTRQVADEMVEIFDERRRHAEELRTGLERGGEPAVSAPPAARRPSLFRRILRRIRGGGD